MAAATATDIAALAALTTTNEHLTKQLSSVTRNLTLALEKIQCLKKSVTSTPSSTVPSTIDSKLQRQYCWSHGFCVNRKHNSTIYKAPKEEHKKQATTINMMRGTNVGHLDAVNEE